MFFDSKKSTPKDVSLIVYWLVIDCVKVIFDCVLVIFGCVGFDCVDQKFGCVKVSLIVYWLNL